MRVRIVALFLIAWSACGSFAWAGIVEDVRSDLGQNNFSAAEAALNSYRGQQGITPEYLEAYSWLGRAALEQREYPQAASYAKQTKALTLDQLKQRSVDAEPHLPIALGAALEVQAQVLAAQGERTQAVALLQTALQRYGSTSIRARLQKNLNLLSLDGKPAPALKSEQFFGPKPPTLASLKGSPVLLFFWAHWCGDCKAEAPVLARIMATYGSQGLVLIGPTQHYGYAAEGMDATPEQETQYIEQIRRQYYRILSTMVVPLAERNFLNYGCSTVPTLVLLDRAGTVRFYHPGAMSYQALAEQIKGLLSPQAAHA